MTRDEMLNLMVADLKNEYTHMVFYLASASLIRGLHRAELGEWLGEWLEEESRSEMGHVLEFSKLLVSLGETPRPYHHDEKVPSLLCPKAIIKHAIDLEQEVCNNYAERIEQADKLSKCAAGYDRRSEAAAWKRVSLFYEGQLEHSHTDLDELRTWLSKSDCHSHHCV